MRLLLLLACSGAAETGSMNDDSGRAGQPTMDTVDSDSPTDSARATDLADIPFDDGDPDRGFALYAGYCESCHGVDGDDTPPPLSYSVPTLTPEEIAEQIRFGGGNMPIIDVDGPEIADLVAYLVLRWGQPTDSGAAR